MREEPSPRLFAFFPIRNGTHFAKTGAGLPNLPELSWRRHADIHMLVPARDAERNSLVKGVLGRSVRCVIHDANQFEFATLLSVYERNRVVGPQGLSRFRL